MAPAPAGRVEAGVPAFAVLGPEAMGFKAFPNGIYLRPDGRVVVTSESELAIGDGVRWETYRPADGQTLIYQEAIVGPDGVLYIGSEGAIDRVDIGSDGLWHTQHVQALPGDSLHTTPLFARTIDGDWYWFAGAGPINKWRPGHPLEIIPSRFAVERLFKVGGELFASEQSSGGLYCLTKDGARVTALDNLTSELVTAVVPFDARSVLVATGFSGLRLFDGKDVTPFALPDITAGGSRINDLCAIGDEFFAAAVDTRGIVFFTRDGKIMQMLDARLDHRLARVQRLLYSKDGVLWGLLNEGIVRVEFPSRISRFEPLITSGLSYVAPYRHQGTLWLHAEGRALRSTYDKTGRLASLERDDPPGRFVFTLGTVDDQLFGTTDAGIFVREGNTWQPVAPGVVNARVGFGKTPSGAIVYVARGEIGTFARTDSGYVVHRIPVPKLGDNYNACTDSHGIAWLELGGANVGRVDSSGPEPTIRLLGAADGLPEGWASIYIFEGEARVQLPSHVVRFDNATSRFVEDRELLRRFPVFAGTSSRVQAAPDGRVWYTYLGQTWTIDAQNPDLPPERVYLPFAPLELTFEADGVVWLRGNHLFERYDPHLPEAVAGQPRAVITSVQFPNSNREEFGVSTLSTVPFADNTMVFRFAAPGNPFESPATFEVQLEGASDRWVSTGNTGQAVFNRIKEGRYTFKVRPVTARSGPGPESTLAFTVTPPWFRTPMAWTAYAFATLGALAFAVWYPSIRQRRENARLEHLVTKRTEELHRTNQQLGQQIEETTQKSNALAVSEERYRALSGDLERRVVERTAQLSVSNEELRQRESLFRLIFEHAPVGISWKRVDLDNLHHFNRAYRDILEMPADTLPDFSSLTNLLHREDMPRKDELEARIARREIDSGRVELRFCLPSGRNVWTSFCVAVVRNTAGEIVQVIGILEDISARKEAERKLATTYKELVDASRMAGMAEVATGVLHNVGNVLNSLNVSANLLSTTVRGSKVESLTKLSALLHDRAHDLATFLTDDPKGKLVPELLQKLAEKAVSDRDWLVQEIASMQKNIDHIKDIVAMQQSYATVLGVTESLEPAALFEDAIRMNAAALSRHDVQLVREFATVPMVRVEKGKVLQILTNVIRNAKYACDDGQAYGAREKIVTVGLEAKEDRVRFVVRDNGIGIPPENLTKIFAHGFTTRAYGHGFGLHSSAIAAREMRGSLSAESEGLGKGATFILEIPVGDGAAAADAPVATLQSRSPIPTT